MQLLDPKTQLVELFCSIQGEGPFVGELQTFVRFQGCALKCRWCDTPENFTAKPVFRFEKNPFSNDWENLPNPVDVKTLSALVDSFPHNRVSLTGGEPLEQVDFLEQWLPAASGNHRFLLETGGTLFRELERVIYWIDVVSMDLKLQSSANTGTFWKEHAEFLKIASGAQHSKISEQNPYPLYVKIVVTADTKASELGEAFSLIASIDPNLLTVLQPVTPIRQIKESPSVAKLFEGYVQGKRVLKQLRIIPQVHRYLSIS